MDCLIDSFNDLPQYNIYIKALKWLTSVFRWKQSLVLEFQSKPLIKNEKKIVIEKNSESYWDSFCFSQPPSLKINLSPLPTNKNFCCQKIRGRFDEKANLWRWNIFDEVKIQTRNIRANDSIWIRLMLWNKS